MEHIQVLSSQKSDKDGRQCVGGDWATVHWKTYDNQHDEEFEDSKVYRKGAPLNFVIGTYRVPKCWEIALASMKAGEKITLKCPPFYAYGGEEKYSHFGSEKIPAYSELIFELDLLNCETTGSKLNKANKRDNNGAPVVETTNEEDDSAVDQDTTGELNQSNEEISSLKSTIDKQQAKLAKTSKNIEEAEKSLKKEMGSEEVKSKMESLMKKEEAVVQAEAIIA